MKKTVSLTIALVLILTLTGCQYIFPFLNVVDEAEEQILEELYNELERDSPPYKSKGKVVDEGLGFTLQELEAALQEKLGLTFSKETLQDDDHKYALHLWTWESDAPPLEIFLYAYPGSDDIQLLFVKSTDHLTDEGIKRFREISAVSLSLIGTDYDEALSTVAAASFLDDDSGLVVDDIYVKVAKMREDSTINFAMKRYEPDRSEPIEF